MLFVSNHVSFLDPVIVGSAASREIHFMARSNAFDIPGLGKLISLYNAYPVNRGAPDLGALRKNDLTFAGWQRCANVSRRHPQR